MTPLPTTVTAVDADLRARADFRGIDERGQVHYLLGMCEALLADANAEIARLRRRVPHDADCDCETCQMARAHDTAEEVTVD
jgi:hypothetical protein